MDRKCPFCLFRLLAELEFLNVSYFRPQKAFVAAFAAHTGFLQGQSHVENVVNPQQVNNLAKDLTLPRYNISSHIFVDRCTVIFSEKMY